MPECLIWVVTFSLAQQFMRLFLMNLNTVSSLNA
jgi:hypothetical protein